MQDGFAVEVGMPERRAVTVGPVSAWRDDRALPHCEQPGGAADAELEGVLGKGPTGSPTAMRWEAAAARVG
jgi:hypothetical protein